MTTYEDAVRRSISKMAEAAKASAANKEKDIRENAMYWYGKALEYKQMHEVAARREAHADTIIRHILETAPWDSHKAHKQLLKEAREYFGEEET